MGVVRLLAAAAAGALLTSAGPAGAEPFAGTVREATGTARVRGTDGKVYSFELKFVEVTPASGTPSHTLGIKMATCNPYGQCAAPKSYVRQLTASDVEVADDMTSVEVTSTLFGRPLSLGWSNEASPTAVPNVTLDVSTVDFSGGGGTTASAFRMAAFGLTCRSEDGAVYAATTVAAEGYVAPSGQTPPSRGPTGLSPRARLRPACV